MWWFLVSVGSLWKYVRSGSSMPFQMTWWSFVFPNTALVSKNWSLPWTTEGGKGLMSDRSRPLKSWARFSRVEEYRSLALS